MSLEHFLPKKNNKDISLKLVISEPIENPWMSPIVCVDKDEIVILGCNYTML